MIVDCCPACIVSMSQLDKLEDKFVHVNCEQVDPSYLSISPIDTLPGHICQRQLWVGSTCQRQLWTGYVVLHVNLPWPSLAPIFVNINYELLGCVHHGHVGRSCL